MRADAINALRVSGDSGHRVLALAVLHAAVLDARKLEQREGVMRRREEALEWIFSPSCEWWCERAGISVVKVRRRVGG